MLLQNFKPILQNLPKQPGVYRFYDKSKELLYVGKAKNLKNRVSSYFQEGRPKNQRLTLMISQIYSIEYTVVKSEKESLILEANLIHQLQPKYNILLKDDKSYLYVRITNADPIPGIFLTRRKYDPRSSYFGPYTKRMGIFNTLRTLRIIFPYCQEKFPQKRACSYVGIKQCEGICIGAENLENYKEKLEQIKNVLQGKTEEVEQFLNQKIKEAVDCKNYELAALWRDRITILKETISDQKVILPHPQNLDLVSLVWQNTADGLQIASVFIQNIRQGKVINLNNFLLTGTEENEVDLPANSETWDKYISNSILARFFSSYYSNKIEDVPVLVQCQKLADEL